jgi:tRNA(Ile)-lysidine synthase
MKINMNAVEPETPAPLDEAEFGLRLAPLVAKANPQRIGLAVSGGPDSMALAFCASRWAKTAKRESRAFIVDHRLRPESEEEAQTVRAHLEALGIETEILVWHHDEVTTRVHVKAREARYALLAEACAKHGIADLLLAHQAEDQAETILLRFAKGSGIDGLSGMAPAAEQTTKAGKIRLLRPLLGVPKARLIATCNDANIAFVIDPSNAKEKYARGRLRKIMPLLEAEGFTLERLLDLGSRARDAQEALNWVMDAFLAQSAEADPFGVIRLNRANFAPLPREIALRVLAFCLRKIAPSSHPPQREALLTLYEALVAEEEFSLRSLHGCLVTRKKDEIALLREEAAILENPPIAPNQTIIWDNRWKITWQSSTEPAQAAIFTLRPLGRQTDETLDRLAPDLRKKCPEGRARAALPALFQAQTPVALPHFGPSDENSPFFAELL